jgi:hypothetical protein
MIDPAIAQSMYSIARRLRTSQLPFAHLYVTLRLDFGNWTLSISRQGERPADDDVTRIRKAFDVPQDAQKGVGPAGDWYVVQLRWPDKPTQGAMFDTQPLDDNYYSADKD